MQTRHVPRTGPRYWAALSLASVFGANMGDFASHTLHLGHWRGLVPLAALFALILGAEARSLRHAVTKADSPWGEAYYWLAIVTLRTAATNLGDLATHDFHFSYPFTVAALAILLTAFVAVARRSASRRDDGSGVPVTDTAYWATMLIAGTFGTVAGDYVSDDLGLGTGLGSLVLIAVLAAMLGWRALPGAAGIATYWLTVAAVRTAGTTVGDYTAFRHGLNLGLPLSTGVTGVLLVVILAVWPRQSVPRPIVA